MWLVRDTACVAAKLTRHLLFSVVSVVSVVPALAFDPVLPGKSLEFPRDRGAHFGHRIEWWYATGHIEEIGPRASVAGATPGATIGFQVTFFRVRNPDAESNPSRFAPKQLLFAHAAIADPARGKLLHAQKSARLLEGLVEASLADTDVRLDDWSLTRADGAYRARIPAAEFTLELSMVPTQPAMLQGERGFSRKGPGAANASYYYSEPHLAVTGRVAVGGTAREVRGVALMAFRIRDKAGMTLWSNAAIRDPASPQRAPRGEGEATFTPLRRWKSPRTGVEYPIAMEVRAGGTTWRVEPLMDDQELDARASTGTLYWEGAVRVRSAPSQ